MIRFPSRYYKDATKIYAWNQTKLNTLAVLNSPINTHCAYSSMALGVVQCCSCVIILRRNIQWLNTTHHENSGKAVCWNFVPLFMTTEFCLIICPYWFWFFNNWCVCNFDQPFLLCVCFVIKIIYFAFLWCVAILKRGA